MSQHAPPKSASFGGKYTIHGAFGHGLIYIIILYFLFTDGYVNIYII